MTTVPLEEEYQMKLFKWGLVLPKFDVSNFSMTGDLYIDFQTGHFADIKQSKIFSHLATLGK